MNTYTKASSNQEMKISICIGVVVVLFIGFFLFRSDYRFNFKSFTPKTFSSKIISELDVSTLHQPSFAKLEDNASIQVSEQKPFQASTALYPSSPFDVMITDMKIGGSVFIEWKTPPDPAIASWKIYRSLEEESVGDEIADISAKKLNYYDQGIENNQRYYYLVRSVNVDKKESLNTVSFLGIATDSTPPQVPSGVTMGDMGNGQGIRIAWKNPSDKDFSFIRIYRSVEKGDLGTMIQENITDEFYVDSVDPAQAYYYTVTSIDTSGNESFHEFVVGAEGRNIFKP